MPAGAGEIISLAAMILLENLTPRQVENRCFRQWRSYAGSAAPLEAGFATRGAELCLQLSCGVPLRLRRT